MARDKAHIIYKVNGKRVPGVTTVLSVLAKPALITWSNKLGLNGIDVNKYVDDKAAIGTLAHEMIMNHFAGEETDTRDYSPNQVDYAENSVFSYLAWEHGKEIKPILIEHAMVHERLLYGGTCDLYCELDGVKTLVDFKTGSGIFPEHYYQLCAYRKLLFENGYDVDQAMILNIPRAESEAFKVETYTDFETGEEIFQHCLELYKLIKKVKNGN